MVPTLFFSEDKEIYETVKSLFKDDPDELPKVERSVKMFFMNYYVDYPLSAKSILFQMGPIIPILSFLSFIKSYIKSFFVRKNDEQKLTIEKWAIDNFGYFLFKNFLNLILNNSGKLVVINFPIKLYHQAKIRFCKDSKASFFK